MPIETATEHIKAGDWVAITYGGTWPSTPATLPVLTPRQRYGSEKRVTIPVTMTDDLALLLGAYFAEGHTSQQNWTITITNSVEDVLLRAQHAWWSVFGVRAVITKRPDRCMGLVAAGKRVVEFMDVVACGHRASEKRVPDVIARGTREHALLFLRGAALDAYVTHIHAAKWGICLDSAVAIMGLQDLVTRLGVGNAQIPKYNRVYDKTYFELYAPGAPGQELCRLVPFLEPDKQARAEVYLSKTYGPGANDVIPGLDGPSLYALVPRGRSGRNGRGTGRQALTYLCDSRTRMVTRRSLERAAEMGAELPPWITTILDERIHFAPVIQIV